MELKGSRTEQNLLAAFAGESQARNKYTYYASKAKKEGYEQIAAIFQETADNEKEHAELWFKYLHDGKVPTTVDNLKDAASGENYEWTEMYNILRCIRGRVFNRIATIQFVSDRVHDRRPFCRICTVSRRSGRNSDGFRSGGNVCSCPPVKSIT